MGKKQLQLKKGGKGDLQQGGLQEQQHCGKVPGEKTAAGVWGKDREGITAELREERMLCLDI